MSAARSSLVALTTLLALLALAVQLVSDGLYGSLAEPHTLPHHIAGTWPFALMERTGLDRFGAVRVMLARAAIVRSEPARAMALLAPLPISATVVDLRGRAALEANDPGGALRSFAEAGDFIAASSAIDVLGATDPKAALAIVDEFERQLASRGAADPEIGAEVAWREGVIAGAAAARYPADAPAYLHESLAAFGRALARAPGEEKYLLNYAFTALKLGDAATAKTSYVRAGQVVPDSVDAFVGVAVATAVLGDCASARTALARARALATQQHRAADPVAAGYAPAVSDALTRCGA